MLTFIKCSRLLMTIYSIRTSASCCKVLNLVSTFEFGKVPNGVSWVGSC